MDKYDIYVSEPAFEDMDDIASYIATQLNAPNAADNLIDEFVNTISSLANMPKRYPLVRDDLLASLGYRMVPVNNYIVFYSVDESSPETREVNVERVLYFKRNWKHILNPYLK